MRGNVPTEPWDEVATANLMGEAAYEIEGLRKWNAWFAAHNTALKTKNAELLAALENITAGLWAGAVTVPKNNGKSEL